MSVRTLALAALALAAAGPPGPAKVRLTVESSRGVRREATLVPADLV